MKGEPTEPLVWFSLHCYLIEICKLLFVYFKEFNCVKMNFVLVIRKLGLQNSVKKRDFSSAVQSWAMSACHRCLVCLGDIGKYRLGQCDKS